MTDFTSPLTVDGVPLLGNGIPTTFGDYFYVDANDGDDSNDGKTMRTAKLTVLAAYNLTTSNNHDVILMSAASAHTFTAELVVSKNRVHFVGLGGGSRYMGQRTRWEMSTGGGANSGVVRVTGVGCTFTNIKIFNTDTSTSFAVVDIGEFTQWTNVEMVNTVNLGTVTDAHLLCNVDTGYYYRCSIGSLQVAHAFTGSRGCVLFSRSQHTAEKPARDTIFEDCIFLIEADSATGSSCMLFSGATAIERMLWIKNCVFWGSKLSDTINRALQFDNNQTDGDVLLDQCVIHGIDDMTADSTASAYLSGTAVGSGVDAKLGAVASEGGET